MRKTVTSIRIRLLSDLSTKVSLADCPMSILERRSSLAARLTLVTASHFIPVGLRTVSLP